MEPLIFLFFGVEPPQVQVLRNAGEEVTLTVSFLKKTPAFLKLPLGEDCTCKDKHHPSPQRDLSQPL